MIIPILSDELKDPDTGIRQGVCIGLSEVMASAGTSQLISFMDKLIPTIRTALCDSEAEVRESAGLAFSTLYKSAGLQAADEIVLNLQDALEDDGTSDTALDGLKQILRLVSYMNCTISHKFAYNRENVQDLSKKAVETVVLVIDEEGIDSLISELIKGSGDSKASIRRSALYLIGHLFENSKLYLDYEAPRMISTMIVLLTNSDHDTVVTAWEALSKVVSSLPKEVLPSHIKLVCDDVSTTRDKEEERRR